jgi:hypothetical protein
LGCLAFVTVSGAARPAPASEIEPSVALFAGYGRSSGVDVLGPGLGLSAGASFAGGVYVGALALVANGDNHFSIASLAAYAVAGLVF